MVFSILWKTACTIGMARGLAEGAVRRISRAIVQQGQAGATVFSRIWQKANQGKPDQSAAATRMDAPNAVHPAMTARAC
ncbi:MAG TPA: hypothetical protein DIT28_13285 [Oxalobacteraceae bacterium]|nr:hypothetical protein [Oxalobacteraceae bacterium]